MEAENYPFDDGYLVKPKTIRLSCFRGRFAALTASQVEDFGLQAILERMNSFITLLRPAAVDLAVWGFFSGVSDAGGGRFHFIFYFVFKVSNYNFHFSNFDLQECNSKNIRMRDLGKVKT